MTEGAVYVGGHFRWWNNPYAGDAPGDGAVAREGLAALSPVNGLPFSWNPTRTKGVGVFDFLYGDRGLWIASDTDRIGHFQYKGRIALLPRGGKTYAPSSSPTLPVTIFGEGSGEDLGSLVGTTYDGTTFGEQAAGPGGGPSWGTVRGAFLLNGRLYAAHGDGTFTRRSFDGTSFGPPVDIDTGPEIDGVSGWRGDLREMTGMFYDQGRIYYTRAGSRQLSYRYFNPESDVVGAQRMTASAAVGGFDPAVVRGLFVAEGMLYWGAVDGSLRRTPWLPGAQSGRPQGASVAVSGPLLDGRIWTTRCLFVSGSG